MKFHGSVSSFLVYAKITILYIFCAAVIIVDDGNCICKLIIWHFNGIILKLKFKSRLTESIGYEVVRASWLNLRRFLALYDCVWINKSICSLSHGEWPLKLLRRRWTNNNSIFGSIKFIHIIEFNMYIYIFLFWEKLMNVLSALVLENIFKNFYGKKEKKLTAFIF